MQQQIKKKKNEPIKQKFKGYTGHTIELEKYRLWLLITHYKYQTKWCFLHHFIELIINA